MKNSRGRYDGQTARSHAHNIVAAGVSYDDAVVALYEFYRYNYAKKVVRFMTRILAGKDSG